MPARPPSALFEETRGWGATDRSGIAHRGKIVPRSRGERAARAGRRRSAAKRTSAATSSSLAASARALRPGGYLVFSVEAATPEAAPSGHRINPHGRYSHTAAYLERSLAQAGLTVANMAAVVLRFENKDPVNGHVVTARRPN